MKHIPYSLKKIPFYLLGFVLFFAPFALFQKSISYLLGQPSEQLTIHNLCFRIPIEHFISGRFFTISDLAIVGTILLLLIALIFGPLFCGFLCPAGGLTEYLSKILPSKFKINWSKHLPVTAVRYGFLTGFLLAPFTDGLIACAYCNFYAFDLLINYVLFGYIVAFSSSMLLTIVLWLLVLGLFSQGGRGFCMFFCPVGAMQSFFHYLGSKLPFSFQLSFGQSKCTKCKQCVLSCPMTALTMQNDLSHNRHICILCMQCLNSCPNKNIRYMATKGDTDESLV